MKNNGNIDVNGLLAWCNSVEDTFQPKEVLQHPSHAAMIPEQFLATAIRYIRALCNEVNAK